jgi:hypothetical protein
VEGREEAEEKEETKENGTERLGKRRIRRTSGGTNKNRKQMTEHEIRKVM